MLFNPDTSKQAIEVLFSKNNTPHPILTFNKSTVCSNDSHQRLGIVLYKKLAFGNHLKEKMSKANKGIGLITRLYSLSQSKTLINIYKAFVRPYLNYGYIISDAPSNIKFCKQIESVHYNAAVAITGRIPETSGEKLYQQLGFEHQHDRRSFRRLCLFYKIKKMI